MVDRWKVAKDVAPQNQGVAVAVTFTSQQSANVRSGFASGYATTKMARRKSGRRFAWGRSSHGLSRRAQTKAQRVQDEGAQETGRLHR